MRSPEPISAIHRGVVTILREESGMEPLLELRLDQIFEGKKMAFIRALARIEMSAHQQLCDLRYIDWLRTRTVEFMIWALERSIGVQEEHFGLADVAEMSQREKKDRRSEIRGAFLVSDIALDRSESDAEKVRGFEYLRRYRHLIATFLTSFRRSKK